MNRLFVCCVVAALSIAAHANPTITRTTLFSGFDGKFCKIQPSIATDGRGLAIMGYQKLLLAGSDVFYGQYMTKSTDDGVTWSEPQLVTALADTRENGLRVARYATVFYNRTHNIWYGLGQACTYKNDTMPLSKSINGRPYSWPIYAKLDPKTTTYTEAIPFEFPLPYIGCLPFGQQVELENGDVLVPFYYEPAGIKRNTTSAWGVMGRIVVALCRVDASGFKIIKHGTPIACDHLRRGVGEPSLTRLGNKFYLTLRSDEAGMWCESADGLVFSAPRRWTWTDNGREIENRNTQQHWMKVGDKLYLAYTRVTPTNGHVFRNRAPVFMAEFDPEKGGLVRDTEIVAVPERGARCGNFCCTEDHRGGSWLLTAEWMQPLGCEKYGSDNSLWFVKASVPTAASSKTK